MVATKIITEAVHQRQVTELARWCRWTLIYHTHDSRRSPAGFPDLVLVRPPRILFVELKTDKGRVSPAQRLWLYTLAKCPGVEVYLWRPRDWDSIVAILK